MSKRVMGSLLKLFAQLNELEPDRSRASDGTFPSEEHHLRNPDSDHEPHLVPGVGDLICTAGDYTHDPANGADMDVVAEELRLSRDPRIKYVIRRDRMFSSYPTSKYPAWTWRPYSGGYHGTHMHLSVLDKPIADTWTPWRITMALELDQDIDFTALKNRVHGIQTMQDPIDIGVKGADGKSRLEANQLAQATREIMASLRMMNEALATMSGKLNEIHAAIMATPDPEAPTVAMVEAGLDGYMRKLLADFSRIRGPVSSDADA